MKASNAALRCTANGLEAGGAWSSGAEAGVRPGVRKMVAHGPTADGIAAQACDSLDRWGYGSMAGPVVFLFFN